MRVALRGADGAVVVDVGGAVVVVVSAAVVVVVVVASAAVVVVVVVVVVVAVVFVVVVAALVVGSGVVGGESASAAATSPIPKSSMVPRIAISRFRAMGRIIDAVRISSGHRAKGEPEMGTIAVSENVSLDEVAEGPAGDEGFGRGGIGLPRKR